MKKLFLLLSIFFILTSCGKSNEERINDLIAEATKASLYIPESYDPVSTQCDTLYRDIINPANIDKSAKIMSLIHSIQSTQREMEYCVRQRDFLSGKSAELYNDYAKRVISGEETIDGLKAQANKLFAELQKDFYNDRGFYGFIVEHRFRAKNNMGTVMFGDMIYIINKDITEVVAAYDTSDNDFVEFMQMVEAIQEIGENYNLDEINLVEICANIKSVYELRYDH